MTLRPVSESLGYILGEIDSVPVPGSTPDPDSSMTPAPGSAPSSGSVSVLVRVRYRDYIVQVSVPDDAHPRYISRCYRGRYTLTSDPLYARTWSNPDLAWHHTLTLKEKFVDDPSSIRLNDNKRS